LLKNTLEHIKLTELSTFDTLGGKVLHGIKKGDDGYINFGEAYFSFVNPKAIKAWKLHKRMTLNLVVPIGMVRFVFCDPLKLDNFRIEDIGEKNYVRITVPPNIWFGFQGLSQQPSLVANIADLKHDSNEVIRKEVKELSYKW
tara:strand:- start:20147 stop:20575 length:429 start_codon:yes stop_codon:yes gene_type:complete